MTPVPTTPEQRIQEAFERCNEEIKRFQQRVAEAVREFERVYAETVVKATLSNSWTTTQTHTECVDCEAAVEMAIQHATNLRILSAKWTIATPYSEMPSLAVEHVGTADRS
jgi:hypothetical protein